MREFSIALGKQLLGLRPSDRAPVGSPGLRALTNMRPTAGALLATPGYPVFPATVSWPFPQAFVGKGQTLLAGETTIGTVSGSTVTPLTLYNPSNGAAATLASGGGQWQFLDFYDSWVLLNGKAVVYLGAEASAVGLTDVPFVSTESTITTGCTHRGRALYAGFDPAKFWTSDWESYWASVIPDDTGLALSVAPRKNFVMWSEIGSGGIPLPLRYDLGMNSIIENAGFSSSDAYYMDLLSRGDMGMMPIPFQGDILRIEGIDSGVIVFSENGVCTLEAKNVQMFDGVLPTYGLSVVSHVGLMERGAVSNDGERIFFIDKSGYLWTIGAGLKAERLGYREFFFPLSGETFSGFSDPIEGVQGISTSTTSYFLSPEGIGTSSQPITSIVSLEGVSRAVSSSASSTSISLETNFYDFGNKALKRLSVVEMGSTGLTNPKVSVRYRTTTSGAYLTTTPKPFSPQGLAFPMIAGIEFAVIITATGAADARLDYLALRWQQDDQRGVRGLSNASQASE